MLRLLVGFAVLALIGCNKGPTKPEASTSKPGAATQPAKVDGKVELKIKCFLGCQPSQAAIKEALSKEAKLSDVVLDPAANTVTCRILPQDYNHVELRSALSKVGLGGRIACSDPKLDMSQFAIVGLDVMEDKPVEAMTFSGVFAASPESQKAITAAVAPLKVTFEGDGPRRSVTVEGKAFDANKTASSLRDAGFTWSSYFAG